MLKMSYFITFLLLFSGFPLKQVQVLDAETKKPIPFVSFSKLVDQKGSFADEMGLIDFSLDLNQSYIISCVGYKSDTIIPSKLDRLILLQPKTIELQNIDIVAKRLKKSLIEIGYLSSFALVPYWDGLSKKIQISTFIPTPNKDINFGISHIKIDLGAAKSKLYNGYKIRLFIKANDNKSPGKDLLTKDVVIFFKVNNYKLVYPLDETVLLPKDGCFVGFEPVGKIDKNNQFIPFTDFYEKATPFQLSIKLVNSNSYSKVKQGSFNWMRISYSNNHPDTYAIGLDVYPISK